MSRYQTRPVVVDAVRIERPWKKAIDFFSSDEVVALKNGNAFYGISVPTRGGRQTAMPSDWIVRFPDGRLEVVHCAAFQREYEPARELP